MSADDISDRLIADALQVQVAGQIIGREIVVIESTTSTNDSILQRITPNTPEGLVVFAEEQTAGRGQRGSSWHSPTGKGLWLSILLHPEIDLNDSAKLTAWAAETVARLIETELSLKTRTKPPNDVYLDDRKLAGVLVEMRAQPKARHFAIAGIGINVNQAPEDFPTELQGHAISLAVALGRQVDRQKLAVALLRQLDQSYREVFR